MSREPEVSSELVAPQSASEMSGVNLGKFSHFPPVLWLKDENHNA